MKVAQQANVSVMKMVMDKAAVPHLGGNVDIKL